MDEGPTGRFNSLTGGCQMSFTGADLGADLGAGVDVGGTKIAACVADLGAGTLLASGQVPTCPERGGTHVLEAAVSLLAGLTAPSPVRSVGVALCELVDREGRPASAYTVDWRDLDVAAAFDGIAPVRLESDVRAAALAEARFGAGRGAELPWLYASVGTGISHCLVLGGEPYAGAHGNALLLGAPMIEAVSSGLALQRASGHARAQEVLADPRCAALVAGAAAALGRALAVLVNALDPAFLVVGGGLGLDPAYREAAVAAMRDAVELDAARALPVLPAHLGPLGTALGAALAGARS